MLENQAVRVAMEGDLDKPFVVSNDYFTDCPRCGMAVGVQQIERHKEWHRTLGH